MKSREFLKTVQDKSESAIVKQIKILRKEFQDLVVNLKLGKERNHRKLREVKKNIARSFTSLNQKVKK